MPCCRTQFAAELDGRFDLGRGLADDAQRDRAVLQIEALADRDVGRQIRDTWRETRSAVPAIVDRS